MSDVKIARVYPKDGSWYYVEDLAERNPKTGRPKQKWHKLCRMDAGETVLLEKLAAFKRHTDPRQGNIGDAIKGFLRWKAPDLKNQLVRKDYERMFGIIGAKLVQFNVDQVTPGDILTFLERFAARPTARRSYKARLSTFFSWAVLQAMRKDNPCREIKLKAPPKRRRQIRDEATWFAVYDELPPILQCFADLVFLTTARPTEIRLLDENQIDGGVIRFTPTKTEETSGATVDWPITPEIAAVLERARKLNKVRALRGKICPVIQTRAGDFYTTEALGDAWKAAATKAGHPNVTTRDIRPYALVCAEHQGYDLRALQQAAAHTTSATTEGYLDQYRDVVSPVRMALPARSQSTPEKP